MPKTTKVISKRRFWRIFLSWNWIFVLDRKPSILGKDFWKNLAQNWAPSFKKIDFYLLTPFKIASDFTQREDVFIRCRKISKVSQFWSEMILDREILKISITFCDSCIGNLLKDIYIGGIFRLGLTFLSMRNGVPP